jgi:hypothetical protein
MREVRHGQAQPERLHAASAGIVGGSASTAAATSSSRRPYLSTRVRLRQHASSCSMRGRRGGKAGSW